MAKGIESIESIDARLNSAKEAQSRVRVTAVSLAVITSMMIVINFNAYMSYDRDWLLAANVKIKDSSFNKEHTGHIEYLQKAYFDQTLKTWNESRYINIAFLGVKVSVDDVLVLGDLALILTSFWLLLCSRRENQTIGFLLRDTDDLSELSLVSLPSGKDNPPEKSSIQWYIFHSIISNALIYDISNSFSPIAEIKGATKASITAEKSLEVKNNYLFKVFSKLFFKYPFYASVFILFLEVMSFKLLSDPFEVFSLNATSVINSRLILNISIGSTMILILYKILDLATKYARATEKILFEYYENINISTPKSI